MAWHPFKHLGLKLLSLILAAVLWVTITRDQLVERSLRVPLEFQNIPEALEITGDSPGVVDVRLRGPSSILGRLDTGDVVAVVDLRGARPGQRLFHLLTDSVRVPFGIEVSQINPATVPLTFERSASRIVPVVPTLEGEPSFGYMAGRVTIEPTQVEVVGPISRLDVLREATTEPISLDKATSTIEDTVTVGVVDAALRLKEPRSANVRIEIVPAPIERAVQGLSVEVRNVGRGLRASVNPAKITVMVRGSRESLGSLDLEELHPWVDAASLEPGQYVLPVKFDPGEDFGISRVEPTVIEVRIR